MKDFLRKFPKLYNIIRKTYYKFRLRRLREILYGTAEREKEWETRHIDGAGRDDWGKSGNDWIKGYWDTIDHPHRKFLADRIEKYCPIKSILEIGSSCGPNLALLSRRLRDARITGVDINQEAVKKGNEWLSGNSFSNVELICRKADNLSIFQDKSFDIVFTDAVLLYIGPDKIENVIQNMLRISRRAVILCEWNDFLGEDKTGLGVSDIGVWKRDYKILLKKFVDGGKINITKIPPDIWPSEGWIEHGAIVEVAK